MGTADIHQNKYMPKELAYNNQLGAEIHYTIVPKTALVDLTCEPIAGVLVDLDVASWWRYSSEQNDHCRGKNVLARSQNQKCVLRLKFGMWYGLENRAPLSAMCEVGFVLFFLRTNGHYRAHLGVHITAFKIGTA